MVTAAAAAVVVASCCRTVVVLSIRAQFGCGVFIKLVVIGDIAPAAANGACNKTSTSKTP